MFLSTPQDDFRAAEHANWDGSSDDSSSDPRAVLRQMEIDYQNQAAKSPPNVPRLLMAGVGFFLIYKLLKGRK